MGPLERRKAIEEEIARTQKNKATEYHIGRLKAQLARIRSDIIEQASRTGGPGDGFDVRKTGDCRVALFGFPSVGKSSFLSRVSTTESCVAAYEFTTLTCVPGNVVYKGSKLQFLDLPGIIEGASEGKGRGRQVIATARTADCILMILDAAKAEGQRAKIERELENVGVRLNGRAPNITFKKKPPCSMNQITYTSTVPQTRGVTEGLVKEVLKDYKIHNADVSLREDVTLDDLIDVIEGNRKYMPCVYCYNKIDTIPIEEVDRLARLPHAVVCSVSLDLNIDDVIEECWNHMGIIRIYTKKKGHPPDLSTPFIVKAGSTIEDVCKRIHKDMKDRFKFGMVWGVSARHSPQRVGLSHTLCDEDVLQILVRTANE